MCKEALLNEIYENPSCTIRGLALEDLKLFYNYFKSECQFESHFNMEECLNDKNQIIKIYKFLNKEIKKRIALGVDNLH